MINCNTAYGLIAVIGDNNAGRAAFHCSLLKTSATMLTSPMVTRMLPGNEIQLRFVQIKTRMGANAK